MKYLWILLLLSSLSAAQINGYSVPATGGVGLTIPIGPGKTIKADGSLVSYLGGTFTLPANSTTFGYVDGNGIVNTGSSVPVGDYPLFQAVTGTTSVTTVTDLRGAIFFSVDANNPKFPGIATGSTACLHINAAGVMSATAGDCSAGNGSGSVTSVGLTLPSWLSVSGSPVTTSGTLAVTAATAQTANQFLATPNGSTGAVGLRAIVSADLPVTIAANTSGNAGTATALASTPTKCGLGNAPTGVDASGNAQQCQALSGATGLSAMTAGQVVVATAATTGTSVPDSCIRANNGLYPATGGDFALQINAACVAATNASGPDCVDARGIATPLWMDSNPFASLVGTGKSCNVYWPKGQIYVSAPIITNSTPHINQGGGGAPGNSPGATQGTQFIACNTATNNVNGCGTNPNSFPNFTSGTTVTTHGSVPGMVTNPNVMWLEGGATLGNQCFDCRLQNVVLDGNGVANMIPYYSYNVEEGSGIFDSDIMNATLACAFFDRADTSPGVGHEEYWDTQCGGPNNVANTGTYGVIFYGGNGSGTAAGPAIFGGATIKGFSGATLARDAVYVDDITSMTMQPAVHTEFVTGFGANIGPAHTTTNVQVSINGANTLTGGLVHFGTFANSSDDAQDVNVSGTQNIIVDDLAGATLTGSTYSKLNFWYAGWGFSPGGQSIPAYCTGTIGTANATAYFLFPSNGSGISCVQTTGLRIPMTAPCLASNFQFKARVAPTTAATFTFLKNNVAAFTGTWTGASTTFSDTTHFVLFNANDDWQISITTGQATDTLADVRGTFSCR